jgi:hypothetical protein
VGDGPSTAARLIETGHDDALGRPVAVPPDGWRDRIRSKTGLAQADPVGMFVAGLAWHRGGFRARRPARPADHPPVLGRVGARQAAPGSSAAVTLGGLALAGVAFRAVRHFELVDKAQAAIGI